MKKRIQTLIVGSVATLLLLFTNSCEKEVIIETSTETSVYGYIIPVNVYWSSQPAKGVKIAEYHTDEKEKNLSFSYDESLGYKLSMKNMGTKDPKGYDIYYIYLDLPEIAETGNSDQPVKVIIPFKIKNRSGEYEQNYSLYRYKCPEIEPSLLQRNWRLFQCRILLGSSWISYDNDGETTSVSTIEKIYVTENDSPIKLDCNNGLMTYYNNKEILPGWPATTGTTVNTTVKNGIWETGTFSQVQICYVNSSFIYCMEPDYDSAGNITDVYYYTFVKM